MKQTWKLGTRGSALAVTQSSHVADALQQAHPGTSVELVIIKTSGDLNQRDPLSQMGGKGVFVKEIEAALLEGSIDFAVHSLKDMPSEQPLGLTLAPPPRRADPRDALVGSVALAAVPPGSRIGTGSMRRQTQLRLCRPDLEFADIRGNVPTRVGKWREGTYPGGVILALAGLRRLGDQAGAAAEEIHPLEVAECVPAPCQGILGVQYRMSDDGAAEYLHALQDPDTTRAAQAERAFLAALGGDCSLPAGGYAEVLGQRLRFTGFLWRDEPRRLVREAELDEAVVLGESVAADLLA